MNIRATHVYPLLDDKQLHAEWLKAVNKSDWTAVEAIEAEQSKRFAAANPSSVVTLERISEEAVTADRRARCADEGASDMIFHDPR